MSQPQVRLPRRCPRGSGGAAHANVPILTAAIDLKLDGHGYFVPGLGGAGNRRFGTK